MKKKNFILSAASVLMAVSVYSAENNFIRNGSFEEEGTRPDGWNQEKQKGWIGYANVPKGKTPEDNAVFKKIRNGMIRKLGADNAPDGKVYLMISSPASLKQGVQNFPSIQNTVYQIVTIPEVNNDGGKMRFTAKLKGTPRKPVTFMFSYLKAQSDGKNRKAAPTFLENIEMKAEWQDISFEIPYHKGCDRLDLTLRLYGTGEVNLDALSLFPVKQ